MEEIQIVLYGKKVNVTKWANSHPGGKAILASFHNRDATEQFEVVHSKEAKDQLNSVFLAKSPVYVATAQEKANTRTTVATDRTLWSAPSTTKADTGPVIYDSKIAAAFMLFKKDLEAKGLFKTNILAESFSMLYTLFMIIAGYYLSCFTSYLWTGVVMMAFGFMQAGWVSHDYLHHAVLPSVYWNDVVGLWLGTLQGYDGDWWKNRHNAHHVSTNEVLHDPDISIAPILHFVQQYPDLKATLKHIQKYQHLYALPLFAFLDVAWRSESFLRAKNMWGKEKAPLLKLLGHYAFALYMLATVGFLPVLMVTLGRGFMTAIIVFSSHYTEERYVTVPINFSLAEQTARTTRNITGGALMNFFSGNISLQIEHHLFPTMPPHNLALAVPHVKRFFAEHNLQYEESSLLECAARIVNSLDMHSPPPPVNTSLRAKQS